MTHGKSYSRLNKRLSQIYQNYSNSFQCLGKLSARLGDFPLQSETSSNLIAVQVKQGFHNHDIAYNAGLFERLSFG